MGIKVGLKGGEQLKKALADLAKKIEKPGTVKVGFLAGATYPNGTSVPMVAAIQEFGAPKVHIPPRPFFRNMIRAKSHEWPTAIAGLLKATDYDTKLTLEQTGEAISGQLQDSIVDTNEPPLSPVTVMLRGMKSQNPGLVVTRKVVAQARARVDAGKTNYGASTKPLIDTNNLRNSVGFEVKT